MTVKKEPTWEAPDKCVFTKSTISKSFTELPKDT